MCRQKRMYRKIKWPFPPPASAHPMPSCSRWCPRQRLASAGGRQQAAGQHRPDGDLGTARRCGSDSSAAKSTTTSRVPRVPRGSKVKSLTDRNSQRYSCVSAPAQRFSRCPRNTPVPPTSGHVSPDWPSLAGWWRGGGRKYADELCLHKRMTPLPAWADSLTKQRGYRLLCKGISLLNQ